MKNWKRWGEFIIVIVASLVVLFGSVLSWDWLVYGKNSDILRNVALTIGGIWAAYAVFLAAIRVKIMQQQQVSESLAKAAEQLSSTIMSVRILAILSLEKIAVEAQDEIRQDVVKVLCAHIREKHSLGNGKSLVVDDDIKEIIYVLGNVQKKDEGININLSKISLLNVQFSGVVLKYADLSGANLLGANLLGANLLGAKLLRANLSGANLADTDLSGVDLSGADLSGADLLDANLSGAVVLGANLSGTVVSGANLSGANLSSANLSNADLWEVNLSGANLSGANLSSADLSGADLSGANLLGANLSGASLLEVRGLGTAKNLETVKNSPQEILLEVQDGNRGDE